MVFDESVKLQVARKRKRASCPTWASGDDWRLDGWLTGERGDIVVVINVGGKAWRGAAPWPDNPEPVLTQPRSDDRDHALHGMQGWDDAAPESLESGT